MVLPNGWSSNHSGPNTPADQLAKWTGDRLDKLLRKIGRAINANNGRCAMIEEALLEAMGLTLDCLNVVDPEK